VWPDKPASAAPVPARFPPRSGAVAGRSPPASWQTSADGIGEQNTLDVVGLVADHEVSPPRVAVVDPTPAYRRGVATTLTEAGFHVDEPHDVVAWGCAGGTRAVMLTVRDGGDWELLEQLGGHCPQLVVVAVLTDATPDSYRDAINAGACSAVAWDADLDHLREVLDAALNKHALLPTDLVRAMTAASSHAPAREWISDEELGWLKILSQGSTIAALATKTGYSERTMYRLLHGLYGRMQVSNRSDAVAKAARWGLLN
jgi:DNA-binding NarL/FixJ family response regulator